MSYFVFYSPRALGFFLVASLSLSSEGGFASASIEPMSVVDRVEIESYVGTWFELARIPNTFQDRTRRGFGPCTQTRAHYEELETGEIAVTNTCIRYHESSGESRVEVARALARVADEETQARLKVNFTGVALLRALGIGNGRYWILHLGPMNSENLYSYALVGEPRRKYGWILSRTRNLPEETVDSILARAEELGYSSEQFKITH